MMGDARRVFKAATTKPPSVVVSSGTGRAVRLAVLVAATDACVAGAGFARHRLPHHALHLCPHHCHRLCPSLRQRAPHDCRQHCQQSPPLNRRGGSVPRASPASFPLRSYPRFVVPDRVPRLWFSHPTQPAAGARPAHLWPAPVCAPAAFRCPALVGPSVCRTDTRRQSCPWPCGATFVLNRYTGDTRLSLPRIRTDIRPTYAHDGCLGARGAVCSDPRHARCGNYRRPPGPRFPDPALY